MLTRHWVYLALKSNEQRFPVLRASTPTAQAELLEKPPTGKAPIRREKHPAEFTAFDESLDDADHVLLPDGGILEEDLFRKSPRLVV